MTKEQAAVILERAQALPHAEPSDFKNHPDWISEEEFATYLKDYSKPTGHCWHCEQRLVVDWGLVHGMAFCTECGMETKMYHYFDKDGQKERWEYGLQYHAKNFSLPDEEDEENEEED